MPMMQLPLHGSIPVFIPGEVPKGQVQLLAYVLRQLGRENEKFALRLSGSCSIGVSVFFLQDHTLPEKATGDEILTT
jgi:hypothetical protein